MENALQNENENELVDKIAIIMRQTDYTDEVARNKLLEANMDHIKVIKDFFGITDKKEKPVKFFQQQIYKEIRGKLDNSIRDFNKKQEEKLEQEIQALKKE